MSRKLSQTKHTKVLKGIVRRLPDGYGENNNKGGGSEEKFS